MPHGERHLAAAAPRVGFVGIWNRPHDLRPWAGVPARLIEALEQLGVSGGYLDATPWPPALRAVRTLLQWPGDGDRAWFFRPTSQALLAASNVVRRALFSSRADAWVVPAMGYGRPVSGRVASLSEISPAQFERADLRVVRSFWPGISQRQVRSFARQQLRLHRAATVCCVASRWAASSLIADHGIDPRRVHVVGWGANVRVKPPTARDWSTPRFVFVGWGWERKNGERVVRAFARLRERYPRATLDLVGEHPRLDGAGVTGHGVLRFTDPVALARLESLYRRATCYVMPSLYEPFGIAYVDAATAGVPSIGTTVGGTADSIGDGGLRVDPLDEDALLAAMVRLSQPEEAMRLGAVARRRSELFTWRKVGERIVRALDLPGLDPSDLEPSLWSASREAPST